jgi:hypothetical protein
MPGPVQIEDPQTTATIKNAAPPEGAAAPPRVHTADGNPIYLRA